MRYRIEFGCDVFSVLVSYLWSRQLKNDFTDKLLVGKKIS
jgi:hypothetical protein